MTRLDPARRRRLTHLGLLASPLLLAWWGGVATSCSAKDEPTDDGALGKSVERIVYVVRQHTVVGPEGVSIDVAGGMGQVVDYDRYVPGARVELRNLATGKVENLIAGHDRADVSSLDLSFDATRVVFSMKLGADDHYHIYWASLEGSGPRELHQLTFGPYDDLFPVYVAGDKVAFVTNQGYTEMGTRADEYNHPRSVTQIGTVTMAGGDADRHLCSQNLSHTVQLFGMADGRVGFSRWEHLENVNDVKLFAMNPDCTQMVAIAGQHDKPGNSLVQVTETNTPNVFLAITTSRQNTIQAGSLLRIDARAEGQPERFDEEAAQYELLTPAVPREEEPSPVGRYQYPVSLPDGRILVSWSGHDFVNELNELALTPPDFGLYLYDPESRQNQLVVNYEDSWEVYGRAVVARQAPPIIASIITTTDATVPARIGSIDVRQTSLTAKHGETVSGAQFDGTPLDQALAQAKKVRIIEGFSSEGSPGTTMFGLTMAEGAALIGEADVYADGSWLAAVPPYVPVHLQPVDEFDLAIRSQTLWIQAMPGEDRVCGGCHENRTGQIIPGAQALTIAGGKGPQPMMQPIAERIEYPWAYANDPANPNEVQKLFDAKCVSCHNETTNGSGPQTFYTLTMANGTLGTSEEFRVPRLDLTSRGVTVEYDRRVAEWPASYVSLFYPAAIQMEIGRGGTVQGEIPPPWAVPSDARGSVLIEKLNVTSSLDPNRTAWPLGEPFSVEGVAGGVRTMHPDDVGITLTRDERVMLIRVIDLGGQFYARQNSAFVPNETDPVAGSGENY
ncbi:MAG: hypothetical protein IT376_13020 [Polyangiaceae bacterium]|nr:hypothetical protein [Polyangiaceae bacterium]